MPKPKRSLETTPGISYVDTRSDTTRRGYHPGRTYGFQASSFHPIADIANAIDRETNMTRSDSPNYRPGLITGEAPNVGMRNPKKVLSTLKQVRKRSKPKYDAYHEILMRDIKKQAKTKDARDKILAERYSLEDAMLKAEETYYDDLYNATKETIESERWLTDEPYLMAEGAEERVFDRMNNNIWADNNAYKPNRYFTKDEYDLIKKAHPKELKRLEDLSSEIWINSNGPSTGSYFPKGFTYYDWLKTRQQRANGGIHIAPSKRGTLTAAATKHGMSPLAFAHKVMNNKDNYSSKMVKKANFAINFNK